MYLLCLFVSLSLSSIAFSQGSLKYAYDDQARGAQLIPLFDKEEIAARKIKAAFMIRHPISWQTADWSKSDPFHSKCQCSYNDTFAVYKFDNKGRLREHVDIFAEKRMTIKYDSLGFREDFNHTIDSTKLKIITTSLKSGEDSIVQITVLERLNKGLDTTYEVTKRYDKRSYLVEVKSAANTKNAKEIYMIHHAGDINYHYHQNYDDQGRLIYYASENGNYYEMISYHTFGRVVDRYETTTKKLINSQAIIITTSRSVPTLSITSGYGATILTYLEKGSKLFKLRSKISFSDFPSIEYEEITYEYYN